MLQFKESNLYIIIDNANFASLEGSLKFLISEGIDWLTGQAPCTVNGQSTWYTL